MSGLPPALVPPRYDELAPPQPENGRRTPVGWICLAILFGLMILQALIVSVQGRPSTAKEKKTTGEEVLLKTEVSQRQLARQMARFGAPPEKTEEAGKAQLDDTISDLAVKSRTDAAAARVYAGMRAEQGKPVPPDNLAPLRASKDPIDRALADVYGPPKLTRDQADALAKRLSGDSFVERLARVHAYEKAGDTKMRDQVFTSSLAIRMSIVLLIGGGILLVSPLMWFWFIRTVFTPGYRPRGVPVSPLTYQDAAQRGVPAGQISLADADRLAVRGAQLFGCFLLLSIVAGLLPLGRAATIFQSVAILVVMVLLAKVPVGPTKFSLERIGLSRQDFGKNVLWGIGAFCAELPLALIMLGIGSVLFRFLPTPSHPATEELLNAKSLGAVLPIILFGSVAAPIWEEFMFRGLLFPAIYRVTGRLVFSAIATGFIFAMIHPQGIVAWLGLATVGAVGCGLTYHRGSLIPSIVMHVLHNSVLFLLTLLISMNN